MSVLSRFSAIGVPTAFVIGIAWFRNQIIKKEKELKDRELELKLQLNHKFD